jgi:hypothetical protein
MAKPGTTTDQNQQRNSDDEDTDKLPVPIEGSGKTVIESTGVLDVDTQNLGDKIPYEDEGYSEAGFLDDDV